MPKNREQKNKPKTGCENRGYDYEVLIATYVALELVKDKSVQTFTMKINSYRHRKFDDLVLEITINNKKENFAIQLKHREEKKATLDAFLSFFNSDSKDDKKFKIGPYREAFEKFKKHLENYYLLLFTNAKFENTENLPNGYKIIKQDKPFKTELFNKNGRIYKFQESKCGEDFYERFFLLSEQPNVDSVKNCISKILEGDYYSNKNVFANFVNFFHENKNSKLITRDTIINELVKAVCNYPYIIQNPETDEGSKIGIIHEALQQYDLTLTPKIDKEFIRRHWKNKNLKSKNENTEQKTLVFIKFDEDLEKSIRSLLPLVKSLEKSKMNFILFQEKFEAESLADISIFPNLYELKPKEFYNKFIKTFKISLQGRQAKSIEDLQKFGIHLEKFITPDDIFYFLEKDLIFGKDIKKELNIPQPYIPKSLLREKCKYMNLPNICKDSPVVVYCNDDPSLETFKHFLQAQNLGLVIEDFKKGSEKLEKKPLLKIHHSKSKYKLTNNPHRLKLLSENNYLQWMETKINCNSPTAFNSKVNVLIGKPGCGKTTILKMFAQNCPLDYWIVFVPLQKESLFFNSNGIEIIEHFLSLTISTNRVKEVCDYLLEKQKIIFFLDGFNELNNNAQKNAIKIIEEIINLNHKVWVSSTENLKSTLELQLPTASFYSIEDITKADQEKYIKDRLKDERKSKFLLEKIVNKNDIFKLFHMLYILTEISKNSQSLQNLETTLNLCNIYSDFISRNFSHNFKKTHCHHEEQLRGIIEGYKNYHFTNYKIAALKLCLESDVFRSLNLEYDKNFLKHLETETNFLDLVNCKEEKILFVHYSFAEYFAALWLDENFEKVPLNCRKFILTQKFVGVKDFFDLKVSIDIPNRYIGRR